MKPTQINGRKIFYDVFIAYADPFILVATNEIASEGITKIYFLRRFSMKWALEDFVKYVDKIKEIKNNEML